MKSWLFFLPLVRCDVIWNGFFGANFTVNHFDQCTSLTPVTQLILTINRVLV
jgi:hypothetical protein